MAQIKKDNSKEMTSLFPDLKPADRIYKVIKTYVFPDLEQIGFKMTKSPLIINRTVGDFEQQISFQKNKWNGGKVVVAFSPSFSVNLTTYEKWHNDRYGTMPLNTTIGYNRAEYIQKWGKKYFSDGWYDLAKIVVLSQMIPELSQTSSVLIQMESVLVQMVPVLIQIIPMLSQMIPLLSQMIPVLIQKIRLLIQMESVLIQRVTLPFQAFRLPCLPWSEY